MNLYGFVANDSVDRWDWLGNGIIVWDGQEGGSPASPNYRPLAPDQTATADWQKALEGIVLNSVSAAGSVTVGVSIPIGVSGFVDLEAGVTPKVYECIDLASMTLKTQLKIEVAVAVSAGVGSSTDIAKFKLPGSAGNTYLDQIQRMKRAARRPSSSRETEKTGLSTPGAYSAGIAGEHEEGDVCPICKNRWTGAVKVGPFGSAFAVLGGDLFGFVTWELGESMSFEKAKLGLEYNVGLKYKIEAKAGLKGQGQGTWYKTID